MPPAWTLPVDNGPFQLIDTLYQGSIAGSTEHPGFQSSNSVEHGQTSTGRQSDRTFELLQPLGQRLILGEIGDCGDTGKKHREQAAQRNAIGAHESSSEFAHTHIVPLSCIAAGINTPRCLGTHGNAPELTG